MNQSLSGLTPEEMIRAVGDAYRRSFSLKGRLGRRGFVHFAIFAYLAWAVLWAVVPGPKFSLDNPLLTFDPFALFSPVGRLKAVTLFLLSVPTVSLYGRRLHDLGRSAGWTLALLAVEGMVPFGSLAVDAALCLLKGSPAANAYGPGDARKAPRRR